MPSLDPVGGDPSALALGRALDAESWSWVQALNAEGPEREAALARLHGLLLRVARHEVHRRSGALRLRGPEFDDLANQAAAQQQQLRAGGISGLAIEDVHTLDLGRVEGGHVPSDQVCGPRAGLQGQALDGVSGRRACRLTSRGPSPLPGDQQRRKTATVADANTMKA